MPARCVNVERTWGGIRQSNCNTVTDQAHSDTYGDLPVSKPSAALSPSHTSTMSHSQPDTSKATQGVCSHTPDMVQSLYLWTHFLSATSMHMSQTQLPEDEEKACWCSGKGQGGLAG
ncbi:MAG: hypothetical protein QOE37_2294 [Microbacteriaceae bacterium]|jgi:hypothetical protein|nr:hypothetical protein [Microbacteriaceae bacterium]